MNSNKSTQARKHHIPLQAIQPISGPSERDSKEQAPSYQNQFKNSKEPNISNLNKQPILARTSLNKWLETDVRDGDDEVDLSAKMRRLVNTEKVIKNKFLAEYFSEKKEKETEPRIKSGSFSQMFDLSLKQKPKLYKNLSKGRHLISKKKCQKLAQSSSSSRNERSLGGRK